MPPPPVPTRTLIQFFVPLAIQAASQALCYPLVAMVASRGPGGPLNLAGLAQANIVMFFFGMFVFRKRYVSLEQPFRLEPGSVGLFGLHVLL